MSTSCPALKGRRQLALVLVLNAPLEMPRSSSGGGDKRRDWLWPGKIIIRQNEILSFFVVIRFRQIAQPQTAMPDGENCRFFSAAASRNGTSRG